MLMCETVLKTRVAGSTDGSVWTISLTSAICEDTDGSSCAAQNRYQAMRGAATNRSYSLVRRSALRRPVTMVMVIQPNRPSGDRWSIRRRRQDAPVAPGAEFREGWPRGRPTVRRGCRSGACFCHPTSADRAPRSTRRPSSSLLIVNLTSQVSANDSRSPAETRGRVDHATSRAVIVETVHLNSSHSASH